MKRLLTHANIMIGTDGTGIANQEALLQSKPHPRNYGTCPRLLGRYVREERLLTLEEAVRKMTGLPAEWLGLSRRGLIKSGFNADLVIFNPETILDRATFDNPHQYPIGIHEVIVNGKVVLSKGQHLGTRSGLVLRRSA